MVFRDDPRLEGRHPEFARMSLRPGIGHDAMWDVASTDLTYNLVESQGDVPSALRHGSRLLPLGRYLRRKLRVMTGMDENAPAITLQKTAEAMRPLLEAAKIDKENVSLKSQILKSNKQRVRQIETRNRIFKGNKTL